MSDAEVDVENGGELVRRYRDLADLRGVPSPMPLDAQSLFLGKPADTVWGEFHAPNPLVLAHRDEWVREAVEQGALKVNVFGSFYRGLYVLDNLARLENGRNDIAVVTGLCTDGVESDSAKVSVNRRVWQFIPEDDRENYVRQLMNLALDRGIPVFTGKVKSQAFREHILPQIFSPDVIFMSTFGQLIDAPIFEAPSHGMYNFHPSDLAHGKFPGPNPFSDLLEAGESSTRMTIHWVDAGFDTGKVVGFSPEICVELESPNKWTKEEHIIAMHIRTSQVAGLMARRLLFEIKETGGRVESLDLETYLADECLEPESLRSLQAPIPGTPQDYFSHRVLKIFE